MATRPARPQLHHAIARRLSRKDRRRTLSRMRALLPVEREEDVFEICLVAVERQDVMARERLHERIGLACQDEDDDRAPPLELPRAVDAVEGPGRRCPGE